MRSGSAVLLLGGTLAVAAGCASFHVSTQVDPAASFAAYHTFSWVSPEDRSEDPAFPGLRREGRRVVTEELEAKGYRVAEGGTPDLVVQFYAFVERDRETIALPEHEESEVATPEPELPRARTRNPSTPRPEDPVAESSAEDVAIEELETEDLEVGDLVLEALDGRTRQVVWRGIGRGILDSKTPTNDLERALKLVLEEFPGASGR